jgi:hypothetical protein
MDRSTPERLPLMQPQKDPLVRNIRLEADLTGPFLIVRDGGS